jgi:2,4-dienoyl-CoA reductase-like NADH-dependent reductase (Old Yellow Enzyme family)
MNKIYCQPHPLSLAEIEDVKKRYVWAATKLAEAGADGIIVGSKCNRYDG